MDLVTRQFVDPLRLRVQTAEPAAILLEPRVLRRVIRLDRRLQGLGLTVPHRKCYTIERDRLLAYVDRSELETAPGIDLPRTVILLAKPTEEELIEAGGANAALAHYGRLLLHASVHGELKRLAMSQADANSWAAERLATIGAIEVSEIRQVLLKDDLLFPSPSELDIYVEFAAVYIELKHYAEQDLPIYFPGMRDWPSIDRLIARDIDHRQLYERTRLVDAIETAPLGDDEPAAPMHIAEPSFISLSAFRRTQARAERAASVGNGIMSAIWHTRAAQLAPRGCAAEAHGSARRELARFARRLQRALEFTEAEADDWCAALEPLLVPAAAGYWTTEARLLYDLQKVCIEQERNVYRLDVVEWIRTFGRRPLRRPLPLRDALMIRHLRTAEGRLATAAMSRDERARVKSLLAEALKGVEQTSRDRIRPLITAALDDVGLTPENVPEQVARRKLVEELVDRIVEHSYISMGDLRDALSKNDLKLPDVGSDYIATAEPPPPLPAKTMWQRLRQTFTRARSACARFARKLWVYLKELLFGDRLLRADRRLDVVLDGVYRRGAMYMRWPQTLSSLAFGTPVGRFLTKHVALPYGGAFLLLEFVRHIAHWILGSGHTTVEMQLATAPHSSGAVPSAAANEVAEHAHPGFFAHLSDPSEWLFYGCVVLLGMWISLLIHRPAFRDWTIAALHRAWHVLRHVLIDLPQGVLYSRFVQSLLNSQAFATIHSYVIRPAIFSSVVCGLMFAAGFDIDARLAFDVFLIVALFLNSSIGRHAIELTTDFVGRVWHELTMRVFAAVVQAVMEWFQGLVVALERVVYAVDQFLRFRAGDNRFMQSIKALGGVVWVFVSYVVVFVFTLLVEPQINPIKHFPVVTVAHKFLLPLSFTRRPSTIASPFAATIMWVLPLSIEQANWFAWSIVWLVPGVFGFLVWELKENWRLYAVNRALQLKPVAIGHHGETMVRLLRPGFHSGTLPKAFAALRRELRHAERASRKRITRKQAVLHDIAEAVRRFVERELVFLLQESGFVGSEQLSVGHVTLATNRIDVELQRADKSSSPAMLSWEDDGRVLRGSVSREGWLASLSPHDRGALTAALSGLFQRAGVDEAVGSLPVKVQPPTMWSKWVEMWSQTPNNIPLQVKVG